MNSRELKAPSIVLLSAGRGSRMGSLTEGIPKSLVPLAEGVVLDALLTHILPRTDGEVVVVSGYGAEKLEAHLAQNYGSRVRSVHNGRFDEDVNILSVETGVSALENPENGYLVVETDLLLDSRAWDQIFAGLRGGSQSFWVCKGKYGPQLTGGIVHGDEQGQIDAIDYRPVHDSHFDGWAKMLGMLFVGPNEALADRRLRAEAISESIKQYYLVPWQKHLKELPCKVLALSDCVAMSFNTVEDFEAAQRAYLGGTEASLKGWGT